MSANQFITTASADMTARPATSFQRFVTYSNVRADQYLLFGDSGEAGIKYDSTLKKLIIDGGGNAVEIRGEGMAPDRIQLEKVFGGKLVTIAASVLFSTDTDFEVLGTSADATEITNGPEGGIVLTTEGAASDQTIVLPLTTASRTPWTSITWGTDQATRYEAVIQTGASITAAKVWVGLKLTNTNVVATDNDQAYFLYDSAAGADATKWHAVYSIAGVDTDAAVSSSIAAVAVSTIYHLVVDIDSSRIARFYVNGVLGATSTALTTATDLIPYVGVMDTAGAAKAITLFKASISRDAGA